MMMPQVPVATAIRIEYMKDSNETFIVFKITDEAFKQEILKDFSKDVELVIKDTMLYRQEK